METGHLEGRAPRRGRRPDRAAGDLHVLLAQRLDHVAGGQPVGRQLVGIEPDPDRELALAEEPHVADAAQADQLVADPRARVVGDVELVVGLVRREHVHDHHQVGRGLPRRDPLAADLLGQARLGDGHAVLDQHLGLVEVCAEREGHGDLDLPVAGRVGGHVDHALDAVDLLLQRRGHCGRHRLGVGPGVGRADDDGRRGDLRVLGHRQLQEGDAAGDQHDQGQDRGEDRPVDEEVGEAHDGGLFGWRGPIRPRAAARSSPARP